MTQFLGQEQDLNFAVSQTLQREGYGLVAIATKLFDYVATNDDPSEIYLLHKTTGDGVAVTLNNDGVQIAHYPFGLNGRTQVNAVRFVMEHTGIKTAPEVISYVRAKMNNKTWAP